MGGVAGSVVLGYIVTRYWNVLRSVYENFVVHFRSSFCILPYEYRNVLDSVFLKMVEWYSILAAIEHPSNVSCLLLCIPPPLNNFINKQF